MQESLQLRHRRAQREQEQQRHVAQLQERCQLLQHQLVTAQDENQRCLQLLEKHQVRVDTSVTHEEDLGVVCGELESEKTMLKQVQSQLIKAQDDARMWQVCCAVLSSLAVFSSTVLHNCISPRLLSALVYLVYLNAYGGWQELAEIRGEALDLSLLSSCANSISPDSSKMIDRGGVRGDAEWQGRVISSQESARGEGASPQYISVNPPLQLSSRKATKMQLFSPALSGSREPAENNHVVEL